MAAQTVSHLVLMAVDSTPHSDSVKQDRVNGINGANGVSGLKHNGRPSE